ncbi:MAG: 5'-methylthioadenosine/adenosylhomocysteine nucleosidase [Clostridia bacterium]|nr:5'-methylthioadenosine/adenosylhomocysteine nucleosidase [Clostridia bacterium]
MEKKKVIGIIGAMDVEVDGLKKNIDNAQTIKIAGIDFIKGTINNTEVVVAKSGVGKVYAAVCTQIMILKFNPDFILNTGVCGSLTKELKACNVVVGEKVLQYDMDTSPLGDPVGLISGINKIYFDCDDKLGNALLDILESKGINHKKGIIATGDKFINDSALVKKLNTDFNAIAGDMESGSIGHVCYINDVPFGIVRSISDSGDENSDVDYAQTVEFAANVTVEVVLELCNRIFKRG